MPPDLRNASVPALALLPLRFFFGVTFIYAGIDKLLDPAFFDPESATSIQSQFQVFERASPLAPLVHAAEPYAVLLGGLIALSEIAVGIGAVTGLAYRVAAIGGTAISFLFFLTASWTTHPYYFGNDLPYAFGWLTLALAGHGDLFVLLLPGTPRHGAHEATDRTRRGLIQVGVLALATLLLGGAAALLRSVRNEPPSTDIGSSPTPGPTISGSPDQSSSPTSTATVVPSTPNGLVVANVSDVQGAGARRFTVPVAAPAPLPAGDPAIVVELPDGTFAAFDALCTHEGCRVSYNFRAKILVCPCHGAEFDPTNHARVLGGPAPEPLLELPLVVDRRTGAIALAVE